MLEFRDMLLDMYNACKNREKFCREQKLKYKPPYKTDDSYESGSHEYWRGKELTYREQGDELLDRIKLIDALLKEDLTNLEAYENYIKDLKGVF